MLIQTLLWLSSSAQHCVTPCCVWSTEPEAMPQKTIKKQKSQSQSLEDRWVCVNSDSFWIDEYVLILTFLRSSAQHCVTPCCVWSTEPEAMPQKTINKQTSQSQSLKDRWVCVNSDSSLSMFLGPTLCDPMLCLKHRARGNATKDNKKTDKSMSKFEG